MPSTLRRCAAAYRLELRLIGWHWSYALLHLVWAGLLIYTHRGFNLDTARSALEGNFGDTAVALISLVAIFVAGAAASRARRLRFAAIDETLPTGTEVVLGRWLAVVTALMAFAAMPLLLALRAGPTGSLLEALPIFAAETLIAIALTTIATWWLIAGVGGRGRWAYLLLVGGWLGCNLGPEFLGTFNLQLPEATLLQFAWVERGSYDELWGRLRDAPLPGWADLCYLGLALVFAALVAMRVQLRRLRRRPVGPGLALLGALGLTIIGGTRYAGALNALDARLIADERAERAYPSTWRSEDEQALATQAATITQYAIVADLMNPARPQFTTTITLRNAGDAPLTRFPLTLNHDFAVSYADVPFTRTGDDIDLHLAPPLAPRATRTISLRYGGTLWSGWRTFGGMPEAIFFTEARGVRLSSAVAWYPIAGRVPTRFVFNRSLLPRQLHLPADVRLVVRTRDDFPIASNLPPTGPDTFGASGAESILLIGSPQVAVEQFGRVRLIAARNSMPVLRTVVPVYERALAHYRQFFPDVAVDSLTLILLDENYGLPGATPTPGQLVVVLYRGAIDAARQTVNAEPFLVGQALASDLWTLSGGRDSSYATFVVGNFLWESYTGKSPYTMVGGMVGGEPDPLQTVITRLKAIYTQQGAAAVGRLFQRMRTELAAEQDNPERVVAWLQEATRAP